MLFSAKSLPAESQDGHETAAHEAPPAPEHPPVEPPAEKPPVDKTPEAPVDLPSVDNWAANTVIQFLDLMDITDVNERRAKLLSLEKGKNEEGIKHLLGLASAYLNLVSAYYHEVSPGDESALATVKLYQGKVAALKQWIGM